VSALHALLAELLDLPPGVRAERLRAIGADDPEGAARLTELLEAGGSGDGPLERLRAPVAESVERGLGAAGAAPRRLGAWRLVARLGEGGMGEVWRAEREEGGFAQPAALKLVRAGLASAHVIARFELERQVLARMRHASIATLLDGGVAEDGRPWFAMELVEGAPLTTYVRDRAPGIEETLRLFLAVCSAVDFAHRSLVVHRDLKPSNILVTPSGDVKLLDFGLAKLLEPDLDPRLTRTEMRALTPAYAAPEQVTGEPVTTATDVYALGVLLFELLAGELPHVRRAIGAALAAEVSRETVERPSARLRRSGGDARRARRLEGDLDTIVLQALHRDPARRYPSAAALAEDLRRHLDGQPVAARRDSARYRAGKFVRRHRVGLAATALVAASLVAGLSVALVQARRARQEADRARREAEHAREEMLFNARAHRFYEAILQDASPVLRQRSEPLTILGAIRLAEERVEEEFADHPALRAYFSTMFGSLELMNADLERAESLAVRGLLAARQVEVRTINEATLVAEAHRNLGELRRRQRRLDEAEELFKEGLRRVEIAIAKDPANPNQGVFVVAANLNSFVAQILNERGRAAEGIPFLERTLVLKERYEPPDALSWGITHYHLAQAQGAAGRHDEAERSFARALEFHGKHLQPSDARYAFLYNAGAELAANRGDLALALERAERALSIGRATNAPAHPGFTLGLARTGEILRRQGRSAEARSRLREALAAAEAASSARDIGLAHRSLGLMARDEGRTSAAQDHFRAARPALQKFYGTPHPLLAELDEALAQLPADR
jgi:serine/threonine-protein kinase